MCSVPFTIPTIRVTAAPTFNAYVRFQLWFFFRQVKWLIPFSVLGLLCFLCWPLFASAEISLLSRYRACLGVLILPGIIFGLGPVSVILSARKRWQEAAELRVPKIYIFSASSIEILADTFRSTMAWSLITVARNGADQVLLGGAQNVFYLVPMKGFDSPDSYSRFRELVAGKVADSKL